MTAPAGDGLCRRAVIFFRICVDSRKGLGLYTAHRRGAALDRCEFASLEAFIHLLVHAASGPGQKVSFSRPFGWEPFAVPVL